jgi:hypothetical protein
MSVEGFHSKTLFSLAFLGALSSLHGAQGFSTGTVLVLQRRQVAASVNSFVALCCLNASTGCCLDDSSFGMSQSGRVFLALLSLVNDPLHFPDCECLPAGTHSLLSCRAARSSSDLVAVAAWGSLFFVRGFSFRLCACPLLCLSCASRGSAVAATSGFPKGVWNLWLGRYGISDFD